MLAPSFMLLLCCMSQEVGSPRTCSVVLLCGAELCNDETTWVFLLCDLDVHMMEHVLCERGI